MEDTIPTSKKPAVPEECNKCSIMWCMKEQGWTQVLEVADYQLRGSQLPSRVRIPSCLPLWKILGSRRGGFLIEGTPNTCRKIQKMTLEGNNL